MTMPIDPQQIHVDKAEQVKQYIELAKLSQASFHNRREYEWKVAFGFWGLIAAATYLLVDKGILLFGSSGSWQWCFTLIFTLTLPAIWFFGWQCPNRAAFDDDDFYKVNYMKAAESVLEGKVPAIAERNRGGFTDIFRHKGSSDWRKFAWTMGQLFLMYFVLFAAWGAMSAAARKPSIVCLEDEVAEAKLVAKCADLMQKIDLAIRLSNSEGFKDDKAKLEHQALKLKLESSVERLKKLQSPKPKDDSSSSRPIVAKGRIAFWNLPELKFEFSIDEGIHPIRLESGPTPKAP